VASVKPNQSQVNLVGGILKRAGTIAVFFVIIAAILSLSAGRLDWIWAWVYLGISLVSVLIDAAIMLRTYPETIAERGKPQETKDWDNQKVRYRLVPGIW